MLVTPRATCELGTQQETGPGCSMLVTPRATCELGTQQETGAALVLTASNSTPSAMSLYVVPGVCQEVDINTGESVLWCSNTRINLQATSMLVTSH